MTKHVTDERTDMAVRKHLKLPFYAALTERRDIQLSEMREWIGKTTEAARALIDGAETESRGLNAEEQLAFDEGMRLVDFWKATVKRTEANGQSVVRSGNYLTANANGGEHRVTEARRAPRFIGRDAEGRTVRGLAPDESFADALRESGEIRSDARVDGVTFGALMRSMVYGPRDADEKRVLAEATDGAGGVTVPAILLAQIVDFMRAKSYVNQAGATTLPLRTLKTSLARMSSDPVAIWHAENTADITDSAPSFERILFTAQTLTALVKISRELFEDSVNLDSAIQGAFAGALAGEVDRVALMGAGSGNEPKGIASYTTGVGKISLGTTGGAQLTDWTNLLDLYSKLITANANPPTAFIMAPRTLIGLAKLQDTLHQPLEMPDLIASIPQFATTKIGVAYTKGTDNNTSKIVTGYWPDCLIGVRSELRVDLMKEIFSGAYQYGLLASMRVDIQLAHPESFAFTEGVLP